MFRSSSNLHVLLSLIFLFFLIHHFYQIHCKDIDSESQRSSTPKLNLRLWFLNETTLTVLWEPPEYISDFTGCKVSIRPPDAVESVHLIHSKGEPVFLNFMKLVPGKAYMITEERTDKEMPLIPSSVVYRTIPLKPSGISITEKFITTDKFKITWMAPDELSEFDKYELSITSGIPPAMTHLIIKIFDKSERTEYEVYRNVLPGHSYTVNVRTISGNISSKPITVNVTLKPLPVQNVSLTQSLKLVWSADSVSQQDTFAINYSDEESYDVRNEEISASKKELVLAKLLPGRKYLIQIQAISNGVRSEARHSYHITPPLPPILKPVIPAEDGLHVSWKSDVNYGQEQFQVVFYRNDSTEKPIHLLTNNTEVFLSHLYPGALYSVRVISLSKYAQQSNSPEVYQAVMPLPPVNVTVQYISINTLSVTWEIPGLSLISSYRFRCKTQDSQHWTQVSFSTKQTSHELTGLLSGEKYNIQVCSVSYSVESSPVDLQWVTPPDAVTDVVALLSPSTIILKFPRPQGHVDFYKISWKAEGTQSMSEQFPYRSNNQERFVLIPIEKLIPGLTYLFSITSVSYYMESSVAIVSARTWPLIDSEIQVLDGVGSNTTSLIINYHPPTNLGFDLFRFELSEFENFVIDKSVRDINTSVRFDAVTPGKLYKVHMWTVSGEVSSVPTQLEHRVQPDSLSKVMSTGITSSSVTIFWKMPRGEFRGFEIQYLDIVLETSSLSIKISELNPYENYTFFVSTLSGSGSLLPRKSPPVSISVQTLESIPGKVSDFHPVYMNAHNITFVWFLPPHDQHGVITKFKLSYMLEETDDWSSSDVAPGENQFTITALKPGRHYSFKIQALTKVGYGPESVWEQQMPPLSPPQPGDQVFPTVVLQTTSTIQIRFRKNFFSDEHGVILYYTIIVSEELNDTSIILRMPGWHDVQLLHPWPPYQALEPYQFFNNTSVVDFTIGDETCATRKQYCNGPLKSGTTYKIKLRAFTATDLFTDTVYTHPVSTEEHYRVLRTLSFIIICIILLGLLVLLRRRARDRSKKPKDLSLQNCSNPITVAHFKTMRFDPSCLSKEFEELKLVGRRQTTIAAELPCNRPKNRFSNVLPYDSSRYKLQSVDDDEGSDYVNANYIAGHTSPRQYIATQGPLASTRDDFWRMCWESKSPAIVMLAQCVEKGRERCHRYWPAGKRVLRCGDIDIHLLQAHHYQGWTVSQLRMSSGEKARVIHHFHFMYWPDCGVPSSPQVLVKFVLGFRARISPEQNPVIVHCSAGVGRTGTFISVDTIVQRLFKSGDAAESVDILGTVYQMRKHRMYMVQTEEQYLYIHECVKLILQGGLSYSPETEVHRNEAFELDEGVDDM